MAYERKQVVGNAAQTTLSTTIDAADLTIIVGDATNWPTGGINGKFVIALGLGTATEEKVLCESRTGTTITVAEGGRGHDNTTAQAHTSGTTTVDHVLDAETIDQVNRLANLGTTKGDQIVHDGVNPVRVANGQTDATNDGFVWQTKWSEATGWVTARLITLLAQAGAPAVAGYIRFWFDTVHQIIRPSDGASWLVPATAPNVADAAARDALFSAPIKGHVCRREDLGFYEGYDGSTWKPLVNGPAPFADVTGRDAYFVTPVDGDSAYTLDTSSEWQYRKDEWIRVNAKHTLSPAQPVAPHTGDIWLQPV